MPRAQSDEQLALAGLRKAVKEGRRGAANDLARYLARRDRHLTPTPTEQRRIAQEAKKAASSVSRATNIIGPVESPGFAQRVLDSLLLDDAEYFACWPGETFTNHQEDA
jgi:hypothetical protein